MSGCRDQTAEMETTTSSVTRGRGTGARARGTASQPPSVRTRQQTASQCHGRGDGAVDLRPREDLMECVPLVD
jgi:hypothetical protein